MMWPMPMSCKSWHEEMTVDEQTKRNGSVDFSTHSILTILTIQSIEMHTTVRRFTFFVIVQSCLRYDTSHSAHGVLVLGYGRHNRLCFASRGTMAETTWATCALNFASHISFAAFYRIRAGPTKKNQTIFFFFFEKWCRVKKIEYNERCAIRTLRSTNLRRKFVYPMQGSRVRTSIAIDMFLYESVYRKSDFRLASQLFSSCSMSVLFSDFGRLLSSFYSPAAKYL